MQLQQILLSMGIYCVKYALIMCFIAWVYNRHSRTHKNYSDSLIARLLRLQSNRLNQSVNHTCSIGGGNWKLWCEETDKLAPTFGYQDHLQWVFPISFAAIFLSISVSRLFYKPRYNQWGQGCLRDGFVYLGPIYLTWINFNPSMDK